MDLLAVASGWITEQLAKKAFDVALDKIKAYSGSGNNNCIVETIRNKFFETYQNRDYYDKLDEFIASNKCIELAVILASSTSSSDQKLNAQYVNILSKKFQNEYPIYRMYSEEIVDVFKMLKQKATIMINISNHPETKKLQVTVIRETEDIKEFIREEHVTTDSTIRDSESRIVNTVKEAFICSDEDIKPFSARVDEIEQNEQKNLLFSEAIDAYNSCFQEASIKLRSKNGSEINEFYCKVLSYIAICYGNLGEFEKAKEHIQRACEISETKSVRSAYAAIALQSKDESMYECALKYIKINLSECAEDFDSLLYFQILSVLQNGPNYKESVFEKILHLADSDEKRGKYYVYKAFAEKFCERYQQAITDFKKATTFGYETIIEEFNVASVYYSMAIENVKTKFALRPNLQWNYLIQCEKQLKKLIIEISDSRFRNLLETEIIKLYLNCCMLLENRNSIYCREDLLAKIWSLDYDTIRSFVLTTPCEYAQEHSFYDNLNTSDSCLWRIQQCIKAKRISEAKKLATEGIENKIFQHPELAYNVLLQIALNNKDFNEFTNISREMIQKNLMVPGYCVMEAYLLEQKGNIEEAKNMIDNVVKGTLDLYDYENAFYFYRRNHYDQESLYLIKCMIDKKEKGLIRITHAEEIYKSIFLFLLDRDIEFCCEFVASIDENEIDKELLFRFELDIAVKKVNLPKIAEYNANLYEITNKNGYRLNEVLALTQSGDLKTATKILGEIDIGHLTQDERWQYYLLHSQLDILNENYESAFVFAKKAHEDNLDRPEHPSHQNYFSVASRTGHVEEGIKDAIEFKHRHPVVVDYMQEMNSVSMNENGEEVPSGDLLAFLDSQKKIAEQWQSYYKKDILGIYQIADKESGDFDGLIAQILSTENGKLHIFEGNIEKLENEIETVQINKSIVIDAFSLVVLEYFKIFKILDCFDTVYIGYSTFIYMQQMAISYNKFSKRYGEIYHWLIGKKCIKIPDGPLKPSEEMRNIFPTHLLAAIETAKKMKCPLLYADKVESILLQTNNDIVEKSDLILISINSLIAVCKDGEKEMRCKLMEKATFINFNAEDIVYWIGCHRPIDEKTLARFLTCNSSVDVESFARVYLAAVKIIKGNDINVAKEFVDVLILNTVKIRRRATYSESIVEEAIEGKIDIHLPFVTEHLKKYHQLVSYTKFMVAGLELLFGDDLELSAKIHEINTYDALEHVNPRTEQLGNFGRDIMQ